MGGVATVIPSSLSNLVEPLRPYWSLVLAAYFFGFFIATLVAIVYNENRMVRRVYVGGFITLLIATNLVLPPVAPLTQWHKFSHVPPAEQIEHEVRVVDANGNELRYDQRATWLVDGVSMRHGQEVLLNGESERQHEFARYLLEEAREYRVHLENRSAVRLLRFPPHGTANTWVASELKAYDRFVAIRLYRMEIETSPDGTEIVGYSEEIIYEFSEEPTTATNTTTAANIAPDKRYPTSRTVQSRLEIAAIRGGSR